MHTDKYFMNQAYKEAMKALSIDEVPVGAVIVKDNKIIARAHNLKETLNLSTAHAEILAINKASKKLKTWHLDDCIMYVTLEPCVMCAGAISWAQLGRLFFGAADEKRGYQRYAPNVLHPKTIVSQGLLAEESSLLMKEFFKNRR